MRNTGWLLFEQIFKMALSLIVLSLMARHLGAADFGLLNYSLAFIMVGTTVTNLGIDSIIVNEMIKNRAEMGKVMGTTIVLRFVSAIISMLGVFFIVRLLNPQDAVLYVITSIHSISLVFIIFDSIDYWFQSNLQSKYVVISKSIAFTIVSCWRVMLIYFEKPVHYFAVATVIEAVLISLFIVIFYVRFQGPTLRFSWQMAKQLLAQGFYFFIGGLLIVVYTQMDKIMIGQLSTSKMVGIYMAALTISSLWMFVANALIESARPLIMAAKLESERLYLLKNKQLYCAIIWIGIAASIVITVLSKPLILLVYGPEFIGAIEVLVILIWSRIFSLIGTIKSIWLTMENLGKFQVYFVGIGAIVNVVLNSLLIPLYGAYGAAIATLFAEVISALFTVLLFKTTRPLFKLIIEAFLFRGVR